MTNKTFVKIYLLFHLIISILLFGFVSFRTYEYRVSKKIIEVEIAEILDRPDNLLLLLGSPIKVRNINEDGVQTYFVVLINEIFSSRFEKNIGDKITLRCNDDFTIVNINDPYYGFPSNIILAALFSIGFFCIVIVSWYKLFFRKAP